MKKQSSNKPVPPENHDYEQMDDFYTEYDTIELLNAGLLEEASKEEIEQIKKELGSRPRKAQVNFRLTEDELGLLKKIADFKAIPYGTLVRSWIVERLRNESKTIK